MKKTVAGVRERLLQVLEEDCCGCERKTVACVGGRLAGVGGRLLQV